LAVEVERLEDTDAGHHPDALAVRHRRRRRHVLFALEVVAAGDCALPDDVFLVAIDGPELELAGVTPGCDVEEDAVAPDDRCGSAERRHRQLPGDVLRRAPMRGKA